MPRWLRITCYVWPLITAIALWIAIDQLAGTHPTRLVCDKAADMCKLSGGSSAPVPPPSHLTGAKLAKKLVHHEGDAYFVALIETNGTELGIGPYNAFEDSAVASYQASVDAINDFVHGPAPHLDTTFVYRASFHEKFSAVLGAIFVLVIQAGLLAVWLRSRKRA